MVEDGYSHSQPTPELPPAIEAGASPLLPRRLVDLFLRPVHFLRSELALGQTPYVLLVTWCYGISSAVERLDSELLRAEVGSPRPSWEQLEPIVLGSWTGFWTWVAVIGAAGGLFAWWIGGWWYRMRLSFSGARDPDRRLARLVLVYTSFVFAGPSVLVALAYTILYENYRVAYETAELLPLVLVFFVFWSVLTSYTGAITVFDVSRWRARLWFLILPVLVYLTVFGVAATLFTFFTG